MLDAELKELMANGTPQTVHLLAGKRSQGELVYEDVQAVPMGDDCYVLLASPLFARGIAKGDAVRVGAAGIFEIEQYGGNVCVRVFAKSDLASIQARLAKDLAALDAECEVANERALVYCINIKQGFDAIEAAFNTALQGRTDAMWLNANVYDPVDGVTPLNWWLDYLAR